MSKNNQNPLSAYFRSPKLYTKIPSGGKFYDENVMDQDAVGEELAIYPMTTKDELLLKNPDALLNGEAVSALIKSCVPQIKHPKQLYSADVDALLIAIRGASGGDEVDVSATCPACENVTDVVISVESSLMSMEELDKEYEKTLANGLVIKALPFTYQNTIKAGIASFQSTRSMQSISEMKDDMERLKAFNTSFVTLADLNFELLIECISSVTFDGEDGQPMVVKDKPTIREFLENTDSKTGKEIETFVNSVNSKGVKQEVQIECSSETCDQVFTAPINFDPVNFFTGS